MNETPLPEPLDDFLQHPPSLSADAARQESLWRQTAALLPRQPSWRRRSRFAAAAAIAVGLFSYLAWFRPAKIEPPPERDVVEHTIIPPPETPQARNLEWTAFDAEDEQERARLYFQAGDLYLDQHRDISSALRCYHQALDCSEARELDFDPNDNWLVMALKRDIRKEK